MPADNRAAALSGEHQCLIALVIERAEQACRYAREHQSFRSTSHAISLDYNDGFAVACDVCEAAIRQIVMAHIVNDFQHTCGFKAGGLRLRHDRGRDWLDERVLKFVGAIAAKARRALLAMSATRTPHHHIQTPVLSSKATPGS